MTKRQRVQYELDTGDVKKLSEDEIVAILRAADELINTGGRSMLAKVLKGSKDKKVLEYNLNKCPAYGFYSQLTIAEITNRIDFMIRKGYLRIEYNGTLPMLVFSDKGWEIEKQTYTQEWFDRLTDMIRNKEVDLQIFQELLKVNRQVVFDVLELIRSTKNMEYCPVLLLWKQAEVRKVRERIQNVISSLEQNVEK